MLTTKDILQWDVRSWSKALTHWEKKIGKNNQTQCGIELGARQGGLSLWMAANGMQVICSDLERAEETAKPFHQQFTFSGSITYADIDATRLPYENYFDVVIFKSIAGGIGRNNNKELQQKLFDAIYRSLKPGGYILFAENAVASPLHRLFRKWFNRWGNYWRYVTINEMKTFLKEYDDVELKTNGFIAAFGRSEWQRNMLARADELLFNKIMPGSWHYIIYGSARKPIVKH